MKVGLWITMRSGFQRAQDGRVCESDIRPDGPDRVPEGVVHGPRQVAFSDVSREDDRRPQAKNQCGDSSSTQQQRNNSRDVRIVTDDRTPPVERRQVLASVFSCEFFIGRNHP